MQGRIRARRRLLKILPVHNYNEKGSIAVWGGCSLFNLVQTICNSLQGCSADLICVGHTHKRLDRRVGTWHVVNPGSISNPVTSEQQASYVLLSAEETGYELEYRLVDYDYESVIQALECQKHPGAAYIIRHLRG